MHTRQCTQRHSASAAARSNPLPDAAPALLVPPVRGASPPPLYQSRCRLTAGLGGALVLDGSSARPSCAGGPRRRERRGSRRVRRAWEHRRGQPSHVRDSQQGGCRTNLPIERVRCPSTGSQPSLTHTRLPRASPACVLTLSQYHLLSAPALLGVAALVRNSPRSALQAVPAALLSTGTALFCGPLYHAALTGDRKMARVAPLGGVTMMAGWVACCLL